MRVQAVLGSQRALLWSSSSVQVIHTNNNPSITLPIDRRDGNSEVLVLNKIGEGARHWPTSRVINTRPASAAI